MPHIINGVRCRTKIESLQHIVDQAKKGKIGPNTKKGDYRGACQYTYSSGNNCAVGILFSKIQRKLIDQEGENESDVTFIADAFGKKNIEAVTGMTIAELQALQKAHDNAFQTYTINREEAIEAVIREAIEAVIREAKRMLERAIVQV